jgi:hypothetical protein
MHTTTNNKFRAAVEVLQKGRDLVMDTIAEDVLDQGEDLLDSSYQFNEFLETQGTRLHFLSLLIQQLEQSAEAVEEQEQAAAAAMVPEPKAKRPRKPRVKKLSANASAESTPEDA